MPELIESDLISDKHIKFYEKELLRYGLDKNVMIHKNQFWFKSVTENQFWFKSVSIVPARKATKKEADHILYVLKKRRLKRINDF
jgi:hypothetical protein